MDPAAASAYVARLEAGAQRHATETGNGAHMVWRRWGEGRPLLLLHGGAGSWLHWVRNVEALAARHAVWVPDLPGFGDSGLPREGLDADSIAPLVLQGARELLGGQGFDVAGFSFGSLVAGHMAAMQAREVERFVAVGMTGMGLTGPPPPLRSLRGVTDAAQRAEVLRANLGAMMLHDPARIDALAIAAQENGVTKERAKGRKLARSDVMLRLAPAWRCPVAGLWGNEDYVYAHQREALRTAAGQLGLRRFVLLEGVGHWAPFEAAGRFNTWLLDLLQTPPPEFGE